MERGIREAIVTAVVHRCIQRPGHPMSGVTRSLMATRPPPKRGFVHALRGDELSRMHLCLRLQVDDLVLGAAGLGCVLDLVDDGDAVLQQEIERAHFPFLKLLIGIKMG
jgi:hypothetical protein